METLCTPVHIYKSAPARSSLSLAAVLFTFAATLFINGLAFGQAPTKGLIAHYPLNNNANDASGNGLNGTVHGAMPTTDRFGHPNSAYAFDGYSNQMISLSIYPAIKRTTMSVSMWVLVDTSACDNYNVSRQTFIMTRQSNSVYYQSYFIGYHLYRDKIGGSCAQEGVYMDYDADANDITQFHKWYHLLLMFNNDSLWFYENGVLQNTTYKGYTTTYIPSDSVTVGSNADDNYRGYLNGKVDDIRFYDHILDKGEIDSLYHDPGAVSSIANMVSFSAPLFDLTPNPAVNNVTLTGLPAKTTRIEIADLTGKIVRVIEKPDIPQQEIELGMLKSGIYFVRSFNNSENSAVKKLVISK